MDYNNFIENTAELSHKSFQKLYHKDNKGTRIKLTKDKKWIANYGTERADLAKLDYSELPNDWKNERRSGAKIAIDVFLKWTDAGKLVDDKFIEYAADIVHEDWLSRNFNRAKNKHRLSYNQLSEDAKEKDRIFVRATIEIISRNKQ